MSEKNYFSDSVGYRSGRPNQSDQVKKHQPDHQTFDEYDLSNGFDAVDELIEVTELPFDGELAPTAHPMPGPHNEPAIVSRPKSVEKSADDSSYVRPASMSHRVDSHHHSERPAVDVTTKSSAHAVRPAHLDSARSESSHFNSARSDASDLESDVQHAMSHHSSREHFSPLYQSARHRRDSAQDSPTRSPYRRPTSSSDFSRHSAPSSEEYSDHSSRPISSGEFSGRTHRSSADYLSRGSKSVPDFASRSTRSLSEVTAEFTEEASKPTTPSTISSNNLSANHDTKHARSRKKRLHPAVTFLLCLIAIGIAGGGTYLVLKFTQKEEPTSAPTPPPAETTPVTITTDGSTTLGFLELENNQQNLVYSPLSIRSGLSLLQAGASGSTKSQIDKVLGNSKVPQYEDISDKLSLANGIFIRSDYRDSIANSYISEVTDNKNAQIIFSDFKDTSIFDNWVNEHTFGLIKNLGLETDDDTKLVLANALAIQLGWENPFDSSHTRDQVFYGVNGSEAEVVTLNETFHSENIYYAQNSTETIVSLPLEPVSGANLDFVAVMPSSKLDTYIDTLNAASLGQKIANLTSASTTPDGIAVSIPKFKFNYQLNFQRDLESLGVASAFNIGTANFSRLSSEKLYVSDAIHKATIDFSESGIKASATTGFGMNTTTLYKDDNNPLAIKIDHPFLFLIRDRNNGAVWFTGTVYTPVYE